MTKTDQPMTFEIRTNAERASKHLHRSLLSGQPNLDVRLNLLEPFKAELGEAILISGAFPVQRSRFLRGLVGLWSEERERFYVNGEDVAQMSFEELVLFRIRCGFAFGHGGLLNNRTLAENVFLPVYYHGLPDANHTEKSWNDYLDYFELREYADQRPAVIPGYARKLTCLFRATVGSPEAIFLEDPLTGLSAQHAHMVLSWFKKYMQAREDKKLSVFISTDSRAAFAEWKFSQVWQAKRLETSAGVNVQFGLTENNLGVDQRTG